jgi:hypothetical protein
MAQPDDMLDDEHYPAYTMGRAAEIVGVSQDFLRRLGEAKLFTPYRSAGGHRRYSRYQLRLAARARELCHQGTDMGVAMALEDALVLGECLIAADEIPEALAGYEYRRVVGRRLLPQLVAQGHQVTVLDWT